MKKIFKNVTGVIHKFWKSSGKNLKLAISIILVVFVLFIGFKIYRVINRPPSIQLELLSSKIEESSELTTTKVTFGGFTDYKDSGIPIINRSDFMMTYKARARLGIDIKKVKLSKSDLKKTIFIKIPPAEVQEIKVIPKSIKVWTEKFALLNLNGKEDMREAMSLSEKDASKELAEMGLMKAADQQAFVLIKGLIMDLVPKGYKIEQKK